MWQERFAPRAIHRKRCCARIALVAIVSAALTAAAAAQTPGANSPSSATRPTAVAKPAPPPASRPFATRQSAFSIPFTAPPSAAGAAPEVHLYLSNDRGATWQPYASKRQAEGAFDFRAGRDGEFWFVSRTSQSGAPAPPKPGEAAELKVLVDTKPPQLEFDAVSGPAGEINASWRIYDTALLANSLRIEYRSGSAGDQQGWKPVTTDTPTPAQSGAVAGRASWRPETSARVVYVRAEVRDEAGNPAVATRQVFLPRVASRRDPAQNSLAANRPQSQPIQRPAPGLGAVPWNTGDASGAQPPAGNVARTPNPGGGSYQSISPHQTSPPTPTPDLYTKPDSAAGRIARQDAPRGAQFPTGQNPAGRSSAGPLADNGRYQPVAGPVHPPLRDRVATDANHPADSQPPSAAATSNGPPPGAQVQRTNSRSFQLDYDVDAVGPQGVAQVELWGTDDGARTWTRWAIDPDQASPIEVQVAGEGEYGFRIIVVGRNGLAGQAPRTGEPADVWVGVDVTKPAAEITSAIYGQGERAGLLEVQWTASDDHLAGAPITLQYSDTPGGPWTTIAAGLANSGGYAWKVDPRVPPQVYLRLEVRDEAGNSHAHELANPIATAGLVPKARIRSVRPAR